MISQADVYERIEIDLGVDPETTHACRSVLNYLFDADRPKENLNHISFIRLKTAIETNDDSLVIKVVRYLSGESLPIINIEFEFIDGNFIEQLSLENVRITQAEDKYYHPETGDPVEDFESKIFMYFSLSDFGREIK
ncbi:hypothetical protein [Serratia plymuthica]|uniref:hypothetical protein n=1 Tax=Serratia plymuthica TaxID=82996 RepID=UPI0007EA5976|nr:hypothetical protein [Serratia plymuthica]ANJ93397.1 hypothetical protein ADP72_10575 [Serratia plymuthica]